MKEIWCVSGLIRSSPGPLLQGLCMIKVLQGPRDNMLFVPECSTIPTLNPGPRTETLNTKSPNAPCRKRHSDN